MDFSREARCPSTKNEGRSQRCMSNEPVIVLMSGNKYVLETSCVITLTDQHFPEYLKIL